MKTRSQFLIGATRSGSGKTLLTLGLLAALARRGVNVQPFKCGPDFIDPTLHQLAAGRPSINLDLYMMGKECCRTSFHHYASESEAMVVEGVMGLFDGGEASSASLAALLDLPVLLVIDVRSAAESVAAVIKGFESFDPRVKICGVICNRIGSARHRKLIEDAVREHCESEVLGFFPRDIDFEMPSRHLGLHMGHEFTGSDARLDKLAAAVEEHIDLDRLLQFAARPVSETVLSTEPSVSQKKRRLAVARDEAFCFYYQENFDLFESCGFELVEFSPLHDTSLPANLDGIYLGGGYPELYGQKLSANVEMRRAIANFATNGGFVYGECGGFMYMTRDLTDGDGEVFPMAAIFPVSVRMKPRLSRLGYRTARIQNDCLLGRAGETVYGHEFHYSDIIARDPGLEYLYSTEDGGKEGCVSDNALGSYIHLHLARSRHCLLRLHEIINSN
ncbi:cobyrinate a,c-diamide synthase [Desulfopila aestuarii]|uniref:Cobyrinate a,c-diamide synthase n=1 Tax=Desulfopila aestuarii DSM 18488 TaxID=1121416 RepID=A0A1M7YC81_9BACT|nr:cobyrinate a,c-diamide synthase [Desulfopila aestuarii]SHO50118.1 hydrogenobyrinic acid a,c-diamide synthase (glutamine-hydrolysing) [Desulfopila aestuarii DSM 18488]